VTAYSDSERAVAIVTAALSAMSDEDGHLVRSATEDPTQEAALLVASDPHPTGVLAVIVGMTCGLIADAALQREMAPIDYWRLACQREAERSVADDR